MIIHKLIARHIRKGDDPAFYRLQAVDAIEWLARQKVRIGPGTTVLDLGAGHGVFGRELLERGCTVVFADATRSLMPELHNAPFVEIDLDQEALEKLGQHDLVICSNVLEHLARPEAFLKSAAQILNRNGFLYLSWTPWLSPWGGHEFSPFHYLGPSWGPRVFEALTRRKRLHTPFVNLFPSYVGKVLETVRREPEIQLVTAVPRYYPELAILMRLPLVREFLTWNAALLIQRRSITEASTRGA